MYFFLLFLITFLKTLYATAPAPSICNCYGGNSVGSSGNCGCQSDSAMTHSLRLLSGPIEVNGKCCFSYESKYTNVNNCGGVQAEQDYVSVTLDQCTGNDINIGGSFSNAGQFNFLVKDNQICQDVGELSNTPMFKINRDCNVGSSCNYQFCIDFHDKSKECCTKQGYGIVKAGNNFWFNEIPVPSCDCPAKPTDSPTDNPTPGPTPSPTPSPTPNPTDIPTLNPTTKPTFYPLTCGGNGFSLAGDKRGIVNLTAPYDILEVTLSQFTGAPVNGVCRLRELTGTEVGNALISNGVCRILNTQPGVFLLDFNNVNALTIDFNIMCISEISCNEKIYLPNEVDVWAKIQTEPVDVALHIDIITRDHTLCTIYDADTFTQVYSDNNSDNDFSCQFTPLDGFVPGKAYLVKLRALYCLVAEAIFNCVIECDTHSHTLIKNVPENKTITLPQSTTKVVVGNFDCNTTCILFGHNLQLVDTGTPTEDCVFDITTTHLNGKTVTLSVVSHTHETNITVGCIGTQSPSVTPTLKPTTYPSPSPTPAPTDLPTPGPTPNPSDSPTPSPSPGPTPSPTPIPTLYPTKSPSFKPTTPPTTQTTATPTVFPTKTPTFEKASSSSSSSSSEDLNNGGCPQNAPLMYCVHPTANSVNIGTYAYFDKKCRGIVCDDDLSVDLPSVVGNGGSSHNWFNSVEDCERACQDAENSSDSGTPLNGDSKDSGSDSNGDGRSDSSTGDSASDSDGDGDSDSSQEVSNGKRLSSSSSSDFTSDGQGTSQSSDGPSAGNNSHQSSDGSGDSHVDDNNDGNSDSSIGNTGGSISSSVTDSEASSSSSSSDSDDGVPNGGSSANSGTPDNGNGDSGSDSNGDGRSDSSTGDSGSDSNQDNNSDSSQMINSNGNRASSSSSSDFTSNSGPTGSSASSGFSHDDSPQDNSDPSGSSNSGGNSDSGNSGEDSDGDGDSDSSNEPSGDSSSSSIRPEASSSSSSSFSSDFPTGGDSDNSGTRANGDSKDSNSDSNNDGNSDSSIGDSNSDSDQDGNSDSSQQLNSNGDRVSSSSSSIFTSDGVNGSSDSESSGYSHDSGTDHSNSNGGNDSDSASGNSGNDDDNLNGSDSSKGRNGASESSSGNTPKPTRTPTKKPTPSPTVPEGCVKKKKAWWKGHSQEKVSSMGSDDSSSVKCPHGYEYVEYAIRSPLYEIKEVNINHGTLNSVLFSTILSIFVFYILG